MSSPLMEPESSTRMTRSYSASFFRSSSHANPVVQRAVFEESGREKKWFRYTVAVLPLKCKRAAYLCPPGRRQLIASECIVASHHRLSRNWWRDLPVDMNLFSVYGKKTLLAKRPRPERREGQWTVMVWKASLLFLIPITVVGWLGQDRVAKHSAGSQVYCGKNSQSFALDLDPW